MLQKKIFNLVLLLAIATTCSIRAKRHSRKKRLDRLENPKKIVITEDQKLSKALSKNSKYMTFNEALLAKNYYMKEHNTDRAIKCGQRLVAVASPEEMMRHQNLIQQTRFELLELLLEKKKYADVEKYALEYQRFYPGTSDTLKAEYITIVANFLAQMPAMKDQEKTRNTIKLAQEFLDKHPQAHHYIPEIQKMLHQSYKKLIRSEMQIITTHINAFNWTKNNAVLEAAEKRLAYCKEHYFSHAPSTKKRLLELEIELAKAGNKDVKILEESLKQLANAAVPSKTEEKKDVGFYDYVSGFFSEDIDAYFDQP